ncbi:MAG: putative transposase [Saprospiraceae bacterium]|jgi:putative transposase
MARPLRLEFEHATYHITSRGDRKEDIYEDDGDRQLFLKILGEVVERYNWVCHAYCLMSNHYHLLIETPDANLSKGMRQLNGVYTQATNRLHHRSGHLFQGRYKGILVDAESYLLEVTRYIVLNPVAAKLVSHPGDWKWSSYLATIGEIPLPEWLAIDVLLAQFNGHRKQAIKRYIQFVDDGIGGKPIWSNLNRQVYLGNDEFIKTAQSKLMGSSDDVNIPIVQRRPPADSLAKISSRHSNRNAAIIEAYRTGEYSYQAIAEYFGLHFSSVGRIIRGKRKVIQRKT